MANLAFTPNPGFAREVARDPQMQRYLDDVVDEAAREVASLAPVGATGDLKESIEGDVQLTEDGYVGEVTVGVWYWFFTEYGTAHHPAEPYLRPGVVKVLASHGGRLTESR